MSGLYPSPPTPLPEYEAADLIPTRRVSEGRSAPRLRFGL
jgi:hypothetical protein